MAMTQAQVNAAVEQSLAKADNLVTVGAMVRDTSGGFVGSIQKVEGELATLKLAGNSLVQLPVSALGSGTSGPVIAMTAAESQTQVATAVPALAVAAPAEPAPGAPGPPHATPSAESPASPDRHA